MIPVAIRTEIMIRLAMAEEEHKVRILFAIESGSRAWGFASPNSDYDVRFIYMHEPAWYQAVDLEERRDVIEYPIVDEIDLNGWDLRKALRLYWKSNPAFVEWLQSPITYMERGDFRQRACELLPRVYAPHKGIFHYRSRAKGNYREYLREPLVPLKKYFYVMRTLLTARWIDGRGTAAPIEFEKLLPLLQDREDVLAAVYQLLEQKRSSVELGRAPRVEVLNDFIEAELARASPEVLPREQGSEVIDALNALFHATLREKE